MYIKKGVCLGIGPSGFVLIDFGPLKYISMIQAQVGPKRLVNLVKCFLALVLV
jgi:hypothetical protein